MFDTREIAIMKDILTEKLIGNYDEIRKLSCEQNANVHKEMNSVRINNIEKDSISINGIIIKIMKLGK